MCAKASVQEATPKASATSKPTGSLQYIEEEVLDRGLDVLITATGCLKQCEDGPIMVVYPNNWWFKGVNSEEAIDAILDGIEENSPPDEYLLS